MTANQDAAATGEPEQELCAECHGDGVVYVRVSRDMAMDAGDVAMEGMKLRVQCGNCGGEGVQP